MSDAASFYDGLAPDYDLLFEDWPLASRRHAEVVAALLAERGVPSHARVLDCTCGIGTQALPLAELGFAVTGTDLSPRAVERARAEAARRGLDLPLTVADVRALRAAVEGDFDAVISCDNALPHLLTDDDLRRALQSVRACLRPGGLFLASVRDYDALAADRVAGVPITLYGESGRRTGSGQAWAWSERADHVDITLFTLREDETGWRVSSHETRYRALGRAALLDAFAATGFAEVEWLTPERTDYYQPVVVGRA